MHNRSLLFENATEGLLLAALKIPSPSIEIILNAITHLLIPFQSSTSGDLAIIFAERCIQVMGKEKAEDILKSLSTAIETKAYPTDRNEWWQGLVKGLRQGGTVPLWIEAKVGKSPKKDDGTTYPKVSLHSGENLSEEDILLLANSYETLSALIDSIASAEYFGWEKILSLIIGKMN
jgi:hypothetical protein